MPTKYGTDTLLRSRGRWAPSSEAETALEARVLARLVGAVAEGLGVTDQIPVL